jgi:hypothetical protein
MTEKAVLIQTIIDRETLIVGTNKEDGHEREKYRDIVVSPNGKFYLGVNEGHLNEDGNRVKARIVLVKAEERVDTEEDTIERLEDFEILYRQEMKRPMEADINNKGEAVIYESVDNQEAEVVLKEPNGENKYVKNFDKNLNTVGVSKKGEVIIVPPVAWPKVSLFDSEGNEIWTKEKPDNFKNFYEVEFKPEKDRITLINPHDDSQLNVDYSGDFKEEESQKDFYGKYQEFHQAFKNKNYEKVEELFSELTESESDKKDRVSVESIYDRMAESQYQMDNHLESVSYWKKAEEVGDLSVSKIKKMRKPFRALVRNREEYDDQRILEEWHYFQDKFEPYMNDNDQSKLEDIKG